MAYDKSDNASNEHARKSKTLYDEFKRKASEHFVPTKVALREAMRIWIKKEIGDTEFSRYAAMYQDYSAMRSDVKKLLKVDSLKELEERINEIVNEY